MKTKKKQLRALQFIKELIDFKIAPQVRLSVHFIYEWLSNINSI